MANWTINGGDFAGETLAAALISGVRFTIQNGGRDSAGFSIADAAPDPSSAPLAMGDDVTLSYDGTVRFRGFVRACIPRENGRSAGWDVSLDGALLKLERTPYKQRRAITGSTYAYFSNVNLGFDEDGNRTDLATTIADIISDTSARHGLSAGSILSGYTTIAPQMQMQDVTAYEAIQRCLSWCPDAVLFLNHSSGNISLVKPASLSGVTLASSGDGNGVASVQLDQKKRFPVAGVEIIYETTTTVDGVSEMDVSIDDAGDTSGMDVVSITIPLSGGEGMILKQDCKTETIPRGYTDFSGSELKEWLGKHVPELETWAAGAHTSALSLVSLTQTVDSTNKVGLGTIPDFGGDDAYPRRILSGACPTWQSGVSSAPVVIKVVLKPGSAFASESSLANFFPGDQKIREFTFHFTGTDAETLTYTKLIQTEGGESPLSGLADDWYAALSANAPAGTIELVGDEPRLDVMPGNKLTLTGPYAVTDAVVQAVTVDVDAGRTVITFGPQGRLTPADLVELSRAGGRRSPVVPGSGTPRTSATPGGKSVEGSVATAVRSVVPTPPALTGGYFWPTLKEPGKVTIAAGLVVYEHLATAGCTDGQVMGGLDFISEADFGSLVDGTYIWAEVTRTQGGPGEIMVTVGSDFFMTGNHYWNYDECNLNSGTTLPSPTENMVAWPLALYTISGGKETVKPLHTGAALYCPPIGFSNTLKECD